MTQATCRDGRRCRACCPLPPVWDYALRIPPCNRASPRQRDISHRGGALFLSKSSLHSSLHYLAARLIRDGAAEAIRAFGLLAMNGRRRLLRRVAQLPEGEFQAILVPVFCLTLADSSTRSRRYAENPRIRLCRWRQLASKASRRGRPRRVAGAGPGRSIPNDRGRGSPRARMVPGGDDDSGPMPLNRPFARSDCLPKQRTSNSAQ